MLLDVYLVHFVEDLLNNKMNVEYIQLNDIVYHKKFLINLDHVLKNKQIQIYFLTNKQDKQHVVDIPFEK
jgi:hypothetical protein